MSATTALKLICISVLVIILTSLGLYARFLYSEVQDKNEQIVKLDEKVGRLQKDLNAVTAWKEGWDAGNVEAIAMKEELEGVVRGSRNNLQKQIDRILKEVKDPEQQQREISMARFDRVNEVYCALEKTHPICLIRGK